MAPDSTYISGTLPTGDLPGVGVYFPSMVINLQLRIDEGLTALPAGLQPKSAKQLADTAVAGPQPVEPVVLARGSDNLSQVLGIVPKKCTVELPGYRQAGTFSFELEYRDLPLDPRIVRSMAVSIYLGAVPAVDFADGMTNFFPAGKRKSILDTSNNNLVLAGIADSIDVDHSSRGSFIRVEGRDLRGIMLDATVAPETLEKINLDLPIDMVISHLINIWSPMCAGIPVSTVPPSEWPGGFVPHPGDPAVLSRTAFDAHGQNQKNTVKGDTGQLKFWDLITDICFKVGAVPYFKAIPGTGNVLMIRPARSLYWWKESENNPSPTAPSVFAGGVKRRLVPPVVAASEEFSFRRLVFGRDIEELRFERKLGGVKVPGVICVSYDTSSGERGAGKLIQAQYPPEGSPALATNVAPSGQAASTEYLKIPVPGVRSQERLLNVAKDLYEEIGRQEMGGSVQTMSLASFGGSNQDPDLLLLRPGDPVEFRTAPADLGTIPPAISELTLEAGRTREEQIKIVADRLGDQNLARAIVMTARDEIQQLQRIWRTSNVKYDWGAESGVAISFDFQNFVVEARNSPEAPTAAV